MVGTLRWAGTTHGVLRPQDRLVLQAQLARLLLERVSRSLRRRLGTSEKLRADLERIRGPETATALLGRAGAQALTSTGGGRRSASAPARSFGALLPSA
jgi:hypothetical protein